MRYGWEEMARLPRRSAGWEDWERRERRQIPKPSPPAPEAEPLSEPASEAEPEPAPDPLPFPTARALDRAELEIRVKVGRPSATITVNHKAPAETHPNLSDCPFAAGAEQHVTISLVLKGREVDVRGCGGAMKERMMREEEEWFSAALQDEVSKLSAALLAVMQERGLSVRILD